MHVNGAREAWKGVWSILCQGEMYSLSGHYAFVPLRVVKLDRDLNDEVLKLRQRSSFASIQLCKHSLQSVVTSLLLYVILKRYNLNIYVVCYLL